MKLKIALKIFFLLISLSATLFAVVQLNTGHMNDFWTSLGLGKKTNSLNWCSDRLLSLTGRTESGDWTLKEEDGKWLVIKNNSDKKTLDYLLIEKWLAKYCILDIAVYKDLAILDMHVTPIAVAEFNDKTSAKIFSLGDKGIFQINEVTFTSQEFTDAISELKNLLKL